MITSKRSSAAVCGSFPDRRLRAYRGSEGIARRQIETAKQADLIAEMTWTHTIGEREAYSHLWASVCSSRQVIAVAGSCISRGSALTENEGKGSLVVTRVSEDEAQ